MTKVIITAAITGAINVPTMSEYLPITPEEIAEEAVRACQAGAAVVHIHARNPIDGKPSSDLELYNKILTKIKKRSNVVVCITTGGGLGMTAEERISVVKEFKPEIASFNTGSMNFALYPLLSRIDNFQHKWEIDYLKMTEDFAFKNTFEDLKHFCNTMYQVGTQPELEIYDIGMINNVVQLINEGYLKKPIYMQFVLGILGGIPATIDNLLFMYNSAAKQIEKFFFSACAAGRYQFPIGISNVLLGGFIRVGLEDSLYISKGVLAKSNAEQVTKAVRIIEEFSLEVATPDDARQILNLKGIDNVNY